MTPCPQCSVLARALRHGESVTCGECGGELRKDQPASPRAPTTLSLTDLLRDCAVIHAWRQRQGVHAIDLDPDRQGPVADDPVRDGSRERVQHRGYLLDRRLAALRGQVRAVIEWLVVYGGSEAVGCLALAGRRAGETGWAELVGRWFHPTIPHDKQGYWGTPQGRTSASTRGTRLLNEAVTAWSKASVEARPKETVT